MFEIGVRLGKLGVDTSKMEVSAIWTERGDECLVVYEGEATEEEVAKAASKTYPQKGAFSADPFGE